MSVREGDSDFYDGLFYFYNHQYYTGVAKISETRSSEYTLAYTTAEVFIPVLLSNAAFLHILKKWIIMLYKEQNLDALHFDAVYC